MSTHSLVQAPVFHIHCRILSVIAAWWPAFLVQELTLMTCLPDLAGIGSVVHCIILPLIHAHLPSANFPCWRHFHTSAPADPAVSEVRQVLTTLWRCICLHRGVMPDGVWLTAHKPVHGSCCIASCITHTLGQILITHRITWSPPSIAPSFLMLMSFWDSSS